MYWRNPLNCFYVTVKTIKRITSVHNINDKSNLNQRVQICCILKGKTTQSNRQCLNFKTWLPIYIMLTSLDPYQTVMFSLLPLECKMTAKGFEYRGTLNTTVTGRTCQRWDKQSPHSHKFSHDDGYPGRSVSGAYNYCRNPISDTIAQEIAPWCYTIDASKRWDFCDVPFCDWSHD